LSVLLFSFNAIVPLLFAMVVGWFIAWKRQINEANIKFLNQLCFRHLMAFHIFNSARSINFYAEFNHKLVIAGALSIFLIMLLAWLVFSLIIPDMARRCVFIVCSFRSNNLIFALPLATNLFGAAGIKAATMLAPVSIILFNFLSVVVMVYHARPHGSSMAGALKRSAIDIVQNPLIIGSVLGMLFALLHIKLPVFLKGGVAMVASAATPVSLILLGAQIDVKKLAGTIKPALAACLLRLVIVPAIVVPVMILAGFRGPELGSLLVVFAAPCAVATMIMARNYDIEPLFAAQTVYLSTILSVVTIFIAVSTLRALGLF
jgi:predicted permease